MEPVSIIALLGIGVATLTISLLLFSPFGNQNANRILAAFLAVLTLFLVQHTISVEGITYRYPHLQGVTLWLYFLLGPLLYYYTYTLTSKKSVDFMVYLHASPTVLSLLAYLPAFFQSAEAKKAFVVSYGGTKQDLNLPGVESTPGLEIISATVEILYFLFALQLLTYAALSLRLLRIHHRAIYDNFSDLDRMRLRWLLALSILVFIAACLIMSSYCLEPVFPGLLFAQQELPSTLLVTILIYFVGFKGVTQPATYSEVKKVQQPSPLEPKDSNRKYQKSVYP